jgi:hypothetical protein
MTRFNVKNLSQRMKRGLQIAAFALTTILAMLYGCSHSEKVLVPPRFDLKSVGNIGVIGFSSNADDLLAQHATQNFIQAAQSAQPGVRFLEIGNQEQVLKSVSHSKLDFEAIKSIGRKFGVDAVLVGNLDISEVKPKVKVSTKWPSLSAEAYIEASLGTKLLEADSGATLWTRSTNRKKSVAKLRVADNGHVKFGLSDPKEKYGKLVSELVDANTSDFWSHY